MAKSAKSATKNESRAAKVAQGYVQKGWLLPPAAIAALAQIKAQIKARDENISETEAVTRALVAYANPDSEMTDAELITLLRSRLAKARK